MEFVLPAKLDHLLDEPSDNRYWVENPPSVSDLSKERQKSLLKEVRDRLFAYDESCLEILKEFETLFAFTHATDKLDVKIQLSLQQVLAAGLNELISQIEMKVADSDQGKIAIQMYVLLLAGVILRTTNENIEAGMVALLKVTQNELKAVWRGAAPPERFLMLFIDVCFSLMEKGRQSFLPEIMMWVDSVAPKEIWESWRAKAVELLFSESENVIDPISRVVRNIPKLACELLRDLAQAVLESQQTNDSQGMKKVGSFIEKLGAKMQKETLMNISVIISLLDCEVYSLRNSIVIAIGSLIQYLIKADQNDEAERETASRYREQLFEILESRVLDKSSFCRSKVLDVLINLNKEDLLPRHRFIPTLKIACSRLKDTAVLVRKRAAQLIESLVYNNKFITDTLIFETRATLKTQVEKSERRKQNIRLAIDRESEDIELNSLEKDQLEQMITKEQLVQNFLGEYNEMLVNLESVVPLMNDLLWSKNSSDSSAAIDALVALKVRGIENAQDATKKILPLVWHKEINVKKAVCNAFRGLYLNARLKSEDDLAKELLDLIVTLNAGELASLEDLYIELYKQDAVPNTLIKRIWKTFQSSESLAAAILLKLTSKTDAQYLNRRYDSFINRTLNLSHNPEIFRECLLVIEKLENQGDKTQNFITQAAHKLIEMKNTGWYGCAEQLIRTIHAVSNESFLIFRAILVKISAPVFAAMASELDIARCIYIGSEIAIRVTIHTDSVKDQYKKKVLASEKQDDLEEISGGKAAQVEHELEQLTTAQENSILTGPMGQISSLTYNLALNFSHLKSETLKKSVVTALSKFMCVCTAYCDKSLDLLLSLAKSADSSVIRSNIAVALGDLVMRYPNKLEPYSFTLFSMLRDDSLLVRKKAILVVTHLVLNDMLKLKGQAADVLTCVLDNDLRSQSLLFLSEYAQKDPNALFNIIPDTVSRLLQMDLTHTQFKKIADELFKNIEKERHGENLVDKFCYKLIGCNDAEAVHICYCISLLPFNEKPLRRLLDHVPNWQPRLLQDSSINSYFSNILTKCKKNWKGESKVLLEEFEFCMKGEDENRKRKQVKSN
jgi:condensin complex subunit 1